MEARFVRWMVCHYGSMPNVGELIAVGRGPFRESTVIPPLGRGVPAYQYGSTVLLRWLSIAFTVKPNEKSQSRCSCRFPSNQNIASPRFTAISCDRVFFLPNAQYHGLAFDVVSSTSAYPLIAVTGGSITSLNP
jgi:hypothetical protein